VTKQEDETMRRSNRASSGAQSKRTTHLDLPSNDDLVGGKRIQKRKGTSKSAIAVSILCGVVALGTLFYASNQVFSSKKIVGGTKRAAVPGPRSLHHSERMTEQSNAILPPDSIYRTKVQDIHGDWQQLMQYTGSVSLVVNVACE